MTTKDDKASSTGRHPHPTISPTQPYSISQEDKLNMPLPKRRYKALRIRKHILVSSSIISTALQYLLIIIFVLTILLYTVYMPELAKGSTAYYQLYHKLKQDDSLAWEYYNQRYISKGIVLFPDISRGSE